jgi:dipeptidase E
MSNVVEACRDILSGVEQPRLVHLPAASVDEPYFRAANAALRPLGTVVTLDADSDPIASMVEELERASVLFMPGGNTYLLSQRLHRSGLFDALRARVQGGLPLIGVSAGSVMCGLNILTTNDMNCCACVDFEGLALAPYNLNVHFPAQTDMARELRIERLWEFHFFFEQPVIVLEDSAYLRVDEEGSRLVRGKAWRVEWGLEMPQPIEPGGLAVPA